MHGLGNLPQNFNIVGVSTMSYFLLMDCISHSYWISIFITLTSSTVATCDCRMVFLCTLCNLKQMSFFFFTDNLQVFVSVNTVCIGLYPKNLFGYLCVLVWNCSLNHFYYVLSFWLVLSAGLLFITDWLCFLLICNWQIYASTIYIFSVWGTVLYMKSLECWYWTRMHYTEN